jgi:excisionase family DNA binding protein
MTDQISASRLISIDELAVLLSASVRTVRRWDAAGRLPRSIKLGGVRRYRLHEVAAWIEAGCPDRKRWESMHDA